MICCGAAMEELTPGTTDAATEKHIPVYHMKDHMVHVTVGSVMHPMDNTHYIEWIALVTAKGVQIKMLEPGEKPEADFALCENEVLINVYSYCNLHSLWMG